jgi:hypothetical protein
MDIVGSMLNASDRVLFVVKKIGAIGAPCIFLVMRFVLFFKRKKNNNNNIFLSDRIKIYSDTINNSEKFKLAFSDNKLILENELAWEFIYGDAVVYKNIKGFIPKIVMDDMVDFYNGLLPCCVNLYMVKTKPSQASLEKSSFLWHTDGYPAACKHLKYYIYLSDVGDDDGPFSYHDFENSRKLINRDGFKPNFPERVQSNNKLSHLLNTGYKTVCGTIGSSFTFSDSDLVHRAGEVKNKPRNAIVFEFLPGNGKDYYRNGNRSMDSFTEAIRYWLS